MTTTLAELETGNARIAFVIAIDGYPHVFSNEPEAAVQAAWADTDWADQSVIGGLIIELDNQQALDPWNPFKASGGHCVVRVQPDAADTFGIDVHRNDGSETVLEETATRTSTLFVGFADGFPWEGEAHCGTECFEYGMISSRRFMGIDLPAPGSNRGKYVAHGVQNSVSRFGALRFSEHHRVAAQDNGVRLAPIVSQRPRTWKGRRVSVWMHTKDPSTGTLHTKADALCVFLGELTEPRDDESGDAVVLAEHLLDRIPKTLLGRETFEATVSYGMKLQAGQRFLFKDDNNTTTRTANDLVVVVSDASGTNQVNAGTYGHEEIASIINAWLGGESAAGRIHGAYNFVAPEDVKGTPKSVMHFFMAGSTSTKMWFRLTWPFGGWAYPLGWGSTVNMMTLDTCGAGHVYVSPFHVRPFDFVGQDTNGTLAIRFEDQIGIFQGQNATLPANAKSVLAASKIPGDAATPYGLFVLDCDSPMVLLGTIADGMLRRIRVLTSSFGGDLNGLIALYEAKVPVGSAPPRIRQLFVHEGPFKTFMKWLFYSTGNVGYNHDTYDILPYGHGLGIPHDALGADFELSCDAMAGADDILTVTYDKPRTVEDHFRADLIVRNAHLVFREGTLRFMSYSTPSSALASVTLDQSNKAEPAGVKASQRTPAVLDSSSMRNSVKINYNRDITKSIGGGEDTFLARPLTFYDATSVDDHGGIPRPITLDLRNVFNDGDQVGQGVRKLVGSLLSWLSFWSRPIWKITRSIAPTLFEGFGAGSVVAVTDPHVRSPTTGERGITALPGLVVRHRYKVIVERPPGKLRYSGEVDVVLVSTDRTFAYAPSAELDETKNDGGFTAGYDGAITLQFKAHEHSESSETVDIGNFAAGDRCKLIEIDPDDPSSVVSWDRFLATVDTASNRATINSPLGSPAFDAAKRYRLVFDRYADAQTSQRAKSFQAGATKTIGELAQPNVYGSASYDLSAGEPTKFDHLRKPEMIATLAHEANVGAARDVGYDDEIATLLENMMDHKTRRSCPTLEFAASTNTSNDGWEILRVEMYHRDELLYGGTVSRYLWIAPTWRSTGQTPAVLTQLRVSISGYLPEGDSRVAPGYTIKAPACSNEWSCMSDATGWRSSDEAKAFPLGNFNGHQYLFVIVEGTKTASCRGFHVFRERERNARDLTALDLADIVRGELGGLLTP